MRTIRTISAHVSFSLNRRRLADLAKENLSRPSARATPAEVHHALKALELAPSDLNSLQLLAGAERASGEPRAARKTYEKMLSIDDKNLPALMGLAEIDMQQKDFDAVLATAERLKKAYDKAHPRA